MSLGRKVRVLVVDDSAFARKTVRDELSSAPDIEVVAHARDGLEALEQIGFVQPDVMTLDLDMPQLDGLEVLKALRNGLGRTRPPKVVVVTGAAADGERALQALELGAIEVVHKPDIPALAAARGDSLTQKVRAAALAIEDSAGVQVLDSTPSIPRLSLAGNRAVTARATDVVVIGTSTGGPRALSTILTSLPKLPVPIAVVVHMPLGFTGPFAERLDSSSELHIVEASDGLEIGPGDAVIAPAGCHLRLVRIATDRARCRLTSVPSDSLHRPSVDVLFASASESFNSRVLGIVLTGMGSDGLEGSRAIRQRGGRVWTEQASSCVIDGMPRSVREAGLSQREATIEGMVEAIVADL